mmetsp:Transcript_38125/g.83734  ORF Transcript_38125/g.83734 Transcript_38125/m.83734 type:complete len:87 (+) Transcript_38125:779-1039(+)
MQSGGYYRWDCALKYIMLYNVQVDGASVDALILGQQRSAAGRSGGEEVLSCRRGELVMCLRVAIGALPPLATTREAQTSASLVGVA